MGQKFFLKEIYNLTKSCLKCIKFFCILVNSYNSQVSVLTRDLKDLL